MNKGRLVFAQLMDHLHLPTFHESVKSYPGVTPTRFSHLDQFLSMAFAQLTYRESLRDIEACLRAHQKKLYHFGIRGKISKTTLAEANEKRDWRIYRDFALHLIKTARDLYANDSFGLELSNTVYALDTTTVDLCLTLFPWARFKQGKAAVKIHTLLDLRGNIPTFIHITEGSVHEVNAMDTLLYEAGSFYIMDRGFLDFKRLYTLSLAHAFFVIRAKSNTKMRRVYSRPVDKTTGCRCDQDVRFTGIKSSKGYPQLLRRIKYYDQETKKTFVFLTNNFDLPALTIVQLYRCRWKIELFFKWIKQHLRIKAFFGTTENAVKTQIWIAIAVYVLVAIVKKRLRSELSLYTILQILSLTLFEKTQLNQLLNDPSLQKQLAPPPNPLILFNF